MGKKVRIIIALLCVLAMLIPTNSFGANVYRVESTTSTYEYVTFGSYPQREVVSQASDSGVYGKDWASEDDYIINAELYSTLQNLPEESWSANGDATVGDEKYRRINSSDATAVSSSESTSENNVESTGENLVGDAPESGPGEKPETTTTAANYYNWSPDITYHYFKYEPIQWRVLSKNGNDYFLLSEIVLDDQMYNPVINGDVPWETCTIRSWLNGYDSSVNTRAIDYNSNNFIDTAFTSNQQSMIKTTYLENADNIDNNTEGGNDTYDKIYLLSESEVYGETATVYGFASSSDKSDTARRAKSSTYAKAMGTCAYLDDYLGNCDWWLRSPGSHSGLTAMIYPSGYVYKGGQHANSKTRGVRPAIHVDFTTTTDNKITGSVTGCPSDSVTVTLKDSDGNSTVVQSSEYSFDNLKEDTYTLTASAGSSYVDREYTIEASGTVTQDIVLRQLGDANGDGTLNASDVTKIARHLANIDIESDEYMLKVFNTDRKGDAPGAADVTHLARYLAGIISL